jgi:hypothetical protein
VIRNHVAREAFVEGIALQLGHLRRNSTSVSCSDQLAESCQVPWRRRWPCQHLAERLDLVALAVVLGELAHLHLGIIALDRFGQKRLAGPGNVPTKPSPVVLVTAPAWQRP